eukprot:152569-Chlamydomonas_euryale.AAC.1
MQRGQGGQKGQRDQRGRRGQGGRRGRRGQKGQGGQRAKLDHALMPSGATSALVAKSVGCATPAFILAHRSMALER